MLQIVIPKAQLFNESTFEFIDVEETTLNLEHSLVSISKWESKWHKPFLTEDHRTKEEILYYIKCMTLNEAVDANVYLVLTEDNLKAIKAYIDDPMSATTIRKMPGPKKREILTSEVIYYSMIAMNVPFECQYWHLNRLIKLLEVCGIKNSPNKKKTPTRDIINRYAEINAARRQKYNSTG